MNSRKLFLTMLGSAISSAVVSSHIAQANVDVMTPLTEWFITRHSFDVLMGCITMVIALKFATAGRRGSRLAMLTDAIAGPVSALYAGAAGGILGWLFGVCAVGASVSTVHLSVWISIMALATLELCTPLVGVAVSTHLVSNYNNSLNRDPQRAKNARPFAYLLMVAAIVFVVMYW